MFITRQLKGLEDTKSAQFNRYFYLLEVCGACACAQLVLSGFLRQLGCIEIPSSSLNASGGTVGLSGTRRPCCKQDERQVVFFSL